MFLPGRPGRHDGAFSQRPASPNSPISEARSWRRAAACPLRCGRRVSLAASSMRARVGFICDAAVIAAYARTPDCSPPVSQVTGDLTIQKRQRHGRARDHRQSRRGRQQRQLEGEVASLIDDDRATFRFSRTVARLCPRSPASLAGLRHGGSNDNPVQNDPHLAAFHQRSTDRRGHSHRLARSKSTRCAHRLCKYSLTAPIVAQGGALSREGRGQKAEITASPLSPRGRGRQGPKDRSRVRGLARLGPCDLDSRRR